MALNQVTLNTWQKQDEKISTGGLKKTGYTGHHISNLEICFVEWYFHDYIKFVIHDF